MTLLMNVIVLDHGILVFGFEENPNLFVVVIRLVKAISSKKSRFMYSLTFIFSNIKKYLSY